MRRTLAFLSAVMISLPAARPAIAAPDAPGIGDQLSLSITNKYGDVLDHPAVAQILGDGLIVQSGTMAMKVKYDDLPPDVRQKYQSLAAGVIQKEENQGAANAAYLAYTRQLQAEQTWHLAAQQAQIDELAKEKPQNQNGPLPVLSIPIPNQNWKLTIANLGFSDWNKEQDTHQFKLRGLPGPSGFNIVLLVEPPANNLPGNDPAYNFYWSGMGQDSAIDAQSVKIEKRDKFTKVSYTAQGQPNVNYFFAYQGQWVDIHLSKGSSDPGDQKAFTEFDNDLAYGQ
jgi:hypothetical protein